MAHFGAVATFRLVDIQRIYNEKAQMFSELFHYSIDFSFMKWYTDKKRETSDKWVVLDVLKIVVSLGAWAAIFYVFTNSVKARINIIPSIVYMIFIASRSLNKI